MVASDETSIDGRVLISTTRDSNLLGSEEMAEVNEERTAAAAAATAATAVEAVVVVEDEVGATIGDSVNGGGSPRRPRITDKGEEGRAEEEEVVVVVGVVVVLVRVVFAMAVASECEEEWEGVFVACVVWILSVVSKCSKKSGVSYGEEGDDGAPFLFIDFSLETTFPISND